MGFGGMEVIIHIILATGLTPLGGLITYKLLTWPTTQAGCVSSGMSHHHLSTSANATWA